jgi:ubiquinone/menaquinone biosynthesis C-methylase UbiE
LGKDKIPFPDNYFDLVYTKSVISMFLDTSFFFKEVYRVLKPGGTFVCLIPDWRSNYKWYWDDFFYVKSFTRKGLDYGMKMSGFRDVSCEYFYQLPFIWEFPEMALLCKIIAKVIPDRFKFKDREQRNTKDRKLIRFSKEKMLLAYGTK